jgi:hypothetical protein
MFLLFVPNPLAVPGLEVGCCTAAGSIADVHFVAFCISIKQATSIYAAPKAYGFTSDLTSPLSVLIDVSA